MAVRDPGWQIAGKASTRKPLDKSPVALVQAVPFLDRKPPRKRGSWPGQLRTGPSESLESIREAEGTIRAEKGKSYASGREIVEAAFA